MVASWEQDFAEEASVLVCEGFAYEDSLNVLSYFVTQESTITNDWSSQENEVIITEIFLD
jgi:hypothetical protein